MDYSLPYLNQTVDVDIDRPLGTKHPKHGYIYPVNYGFVPGTKAPDGAELDAYVLGIDKPLETYNGRCIAIIHRLDDEDDKLIICSKGANFSDEEIRKYTNFQEQWFKSVIVREE